MEKLPMKKNTDYFKLSRYIIIFLSIISFVIASKGFDVLYLFLLADLFCCAFVLTVFFSFYDKNINEKTKENISKITLKKNEKKTK